MSSSSASSAVMRVPTPVMSTQLKTGPPGESESNHRYPKTSGPPEPRIPGLRSGSSLPSWAPACCVTDPPEMMFVPEVQWRSEPPVLQTWIVRVSVEDGARIASMLEGDAWISGGMSAAPDRGTTNVASSGSLVVSVSAPERAPAAVGAKVTFTAIVPLTGTTTGVVKPVWLKSPLIEAPVIVNASVPTFLIVVVRFRVYPTYVVGNVRDVGFALTSG